MIELDSKVKPPKAHQKFNEFDRVLRGLHGLNIYQNPMVLGKTEYFEFTENIKAYREKLNKIFDEVEEYAKAISLVGKHRELVEYATKLMDKANEFAECGCPEDAQLYSIYYDNICRYIIGDYDKLDEDTLSSYELMMGKPYVKYPRRIYVEPTLAKDMYGNNLSSLQYKEVINNLFKLLSDLVTKDAIDSVVVHNDYGLSIMVMIAIKLLKQDGYNLQVIRLEDVNNKEISPKQLDIDNKLRDLVNKIQYEDEGGYNTALVYCGLGEVALKGV